MTSSDSDPDLEEFLMETLIEREKKEAEWKAENEVTVFLVGEMGGPTTISRDDAKIWLRNDECRGNTLKLIRRVSRQVDDVVHTLVCFDKWGNSSADMGCVKDREFLIELRKLETKFGYIIATDGPPFGKNTKIVSLPSNFKC